MARRPVRVYGLEKALGTIARMEKYRFRNADLAEFESAIALRDGIRRKIYEGDPTWPANSPLTVNAKGSSKPLVGNGDLARGATVRRIPGLGSVVGYFHGDKTGDGVDLATIAKLLELGGTIKPKNAKMLAIPVNRAAARAARQYGSVRAIPDLVHPKGTRVLGKPVGRKRFDIWFVLVPQVVIPPRSFVQSTAREMMAELRRIAVNAATATLRGEKYTARHKGMAA